MIARDRVVGLLRSGIPGDARVANSIWTVAEVAAHLAVSIDVYRCLGYGEPSAYTDPLDRHAISHILLDAEPERDLGALAARIPEGTAGLCDELARRAPLEPVLWHAGRTLPAVAHAGAIVGELLLHGRDVARTFNLDCPLPPEAAIVIATFMTAGAPATLDPDRAGDTTATVEVRLRGSEARHTFRFAYGTLRTELHGADEADLRVSADPVAWVLVGYGRANPIVAALLGRIRPVSWPRSFLAWRLHSLLPPP